MKQVLIRSGAATLEDVPAPVVSPGGVLIRLDHSCISVGTEMRGVRISGTSIFRRVLAEPAKLKQAAEMVLSKGVAYVAMPAAPTLAFDEALDRLTTMKYQSNGIAMSYAFRHKDFPGDPREKGGNRRDGPGSRLSHGEEGLEGLPSAEPTPPRLCTPVETE